MISIQETIQSAQNQLNQAGLVDSPHLDAELILCHVLDVNRSYLFTWPEKPLSSNQTTQFNTLLNQRLQGQPIAHIIGHREFWGLNLKVTPDTLIPRPDTETLIEATLALDCFSNRSGSCSITNQPPCSILDLGTGSGAIALALKSELPQCQITAIDQSQAALEVAKHNAIKNQLDVSFLHSNWFASVAQKQFCCIVSNPPYIEDNDPHLQQGDVRFEPLTALTSGQDGLKDIRLIIDQAWSHLNDKGWLVIEHGYNQAQAIADLFAQKGYTNITLHRDLANNPRISLGQKPSCIQS